MLNVSALQQNEETIDELLNCRQRQKDVNLIQTMKKEPFIKGLKWADEKRNLINKLKLT